MYKAFLHENDDSIVPLVSGYGTVWLYYHLPSYYVSHLSRVIIFRNGYGALEAALESLMIQSLISQRGEISASQMLDTLMEQNAIIQQSLLITCQFIIGQVYFSR